MAEVLLCLCVLLQLLAAQALFGVRVCVSKRPAGEQEEEGEKKKDDLRVGVVFLFHIRPLEGFFLLLFLRSQETDLQVDITGEEERWYHFVG